MEKVGTHSIVRDVAARQNCYIRDAREVLNHFVDVIAAALEQGNAIHFAGLGTFYPSRSRGRVRFKPAASLRRRLDQSG